ncbi:MAG: hypothetical protein AAF682_17465 [Planctomycetota bacterium]
MVALLESAAGSARRVPLDEALAWTNITFLSLFLGVVFATMVLRRNALRRPDFALLWVFALFLLTLVGEYVARRSAYGDLWQARREYEVTRASTSESVVFAFGEWNPATEAHEAYLRMAQETDRYLLKMQSMTALAFTLLVVTLAVLISRARAKERSRGWRGMRWLLVLSVLCAMVASCATWWQWHRLGRYYEPGVLEQTLISFGPAVSMGVTGYLLLRAYRRWGSTEGVLYSVGMILYGAIQFAEIGERKLPLTEEQRELYSGAILTLALGLRIAVVGAVVKFPLLRNSREQLQSSLARVPGGIAIGTLRRGRVLEVREPDETTRRLPLRTVRQRRGPVYELDLLELEGEWGYRVTGERFQATEYLASPPESLALLRVLLIPLPSSFLGGDHLLLTFEVESVVRILPRAHLGLMLVRAGGRSDRARDMRVWWCNYHVAALFGRSPRDLCGQPLSQLVHPDWRRRLDDVARDDYSSILAAVERGDASSRPGEFVRVSSCPFGEGQEDSEMLLMMVSSLSGDSHTHTDFLLHNLAHTLRTPIQLVRGSLGRVLADLGQVRDEELRGRLSRLRAEATRLEHAVDLNLQVGRDLIDRGEAPVSFRLGRFLDEEIVGGYECLDARELAPVVRSSRQKLRDFRDRGGLFRVDVEEDAVVEAHRPPLEVMLRELLENALHYAASEAAPPLIAVRAHVDGRVAVVVENRVDADELDRYEEGLLRESQGLSCVRFLSVRYGHPFDIRIDRERCCCVATLLVQRSPLSPPSGEAPARPPLAEERP